MVQTTQGRTALYAVRALIEGKADLNVQAEDGRTSLYEAVVDISQMEIVEALIEGNADLNLQDKDGDTPLLQRSTNRSKQ